MRCIPWDILIVTKYNDMLTEFKKYVDNVFNHKMLQNKFVNAQINADNAITKWERLQDEHESTLKKLLDNETAAKTDIENFKTNLLKSLGLSVDEKVVLHIQHYRDDTVHCYIVERKIECMLSNIHVNNYGFKDKGAFLSPLLHMKGKKSRLHFNQFASWNLYKADGTTLIISHQEDSIIVPGAYTEETLQRTKETCERLQK